MAEKFISLQVKKYNVPRYIVINYNYYRPYFKSEVLLFCKNYDNLAFWLGEFSDFSYAARSISAIFECEFRVNHGLEAAA